MKKRGKRTQRQRDARGTREEEEGGEKRKRRAPGGDVSGAFGGEKVHVCVRRVGVYVEAVRRPLPMRGARQGGRRERLLWLWWNAKHPEWTASEKREKEERNTSAVPPSSSFHFKLQYTAHFVETGPGAVLVGWVGNKPYKVYAAHYLSIPFFSLLPQGFTTHVYA